MISRKIIITSITLALIFIIFIFIMEDFSSAATLEAYPQIDIAGYKKWYYTKINVNPVKNYLLALEDSLVQGNYAGGPWMENLDLSIVGDINKDWRVYYGLWQLGGMPEIYNVGVKYKNLNFSFGGLQSLLTDQEFIFQDKIIGFRGKWSLGPLKFSAISGNYPKARLESPINYNVWREFGNPLYTSYKGTSYYLNNPELEFLGLDLERLDIVDESFAVFLDGKKMVRDSDFLFDASYGLILIPRTYSHAKTVKVIYKSINGKMLERVFDFQQEAKRRAFLSPEFRIIDGSEIVFIDGQRKDRDIDYKVNYNTGLFVMREPLAEDADVRIDYNYTYGSALFASEVITGQTGITINLKYDYIVKNSETVVKNNQALTRNLDYSINYDSGIIDLNQALIASDTLEVSYSYLGVDRKTAVINVEYELSPLSKIGASLTELRSNSDLILGRNGIPAISAATYNFYGETVIDQNTKVRAEIATANYKEYPISIFGSATTEADTALALTGRTRFGPFEFDGAFKKIGLNFPSVRKVKSNSGWKSERADVRIKYSIFDGLSINAGWETASDQQGTAGSPEVNSSVIAAGFDYRHGKCWNLDCDYRVGKQEYSNVLNTTALQSSIYVRQCFDLDEIFPMVRGFADQMDFILKNLQSRKDNELSRGTVIATNEHIQKLDLGWLAKYKGGISSYLLWTSESGRDYNAGTSYDRVTPLIRLSYLWAIGQGHNLEIAYDYSNAQQRGSTAYDKITRGLSLTWTMLIENPVISEMRFEASMSMSDYSDLDDVSNDYKSSIMFFSGAVVF